MALSELDKLRRRMVVPVTMKIGVEHDYICGRTNKNKFGHIIKFVFKIGIEDFIELLGVEAACRLFKYYNRCNLYVPSIKNIQKRIKNSMIREESKSLIKKGVSKEAIGEHLAKKYKVNVCDVRKKMLDSKRIDNNQKLKLEEEQDKYICEIVSQNYEIFKKYDLI